MMRYLIFLLALLFLCTYSYASDIAESEDTFQEHLFSMSWEELMDIEIEASARRPVKLQYVAENISIITAEEIEAMNAHNVGEVLQTVSGLFFRSYGHEISGNGSLSIQGSEYEHVLVLFDGVRTSDIEFLWPDTKGIPVQVIERIEIIKGPASSAWGSALGGVINIITKGTGKQTSPSGMVSASYGEADTQDYRVEAAGHTGKVGYYLYGGYQDGDGLRDDLYFHSRSLYAKLSTEMTTDLAITLSGGYWNPDDRLLVLEEHDFEAFSTQDNYFIRGAVDADLAPGLMLLADLYYYKKDHVSTEKELSTGNPTSIEDWETYDYTGSAKLIWDKGRHSVLFGGEYRHGEVDRRIFDPDLRELDSGDIDEWAIFFNDTIKLDRFTFIPGIRFDHYTVSDLASGDEISPSLGMTYKITDLTLARVTLARGFIRPGGSQISGYEGLSNPDLKAETDRSFQAGIESAENRYLYIKADLFYHEQDNVWDFDRDTFQYINAGTGIKKGLELNTIVHPVEEFTGSFTFTYVDTDPGRARDPDHKKSFISKMQYKEEGLGSLLVTGRYVWFGKTHNPSGSFDDIIWDAHYNKKVFSHNDSGTSVTLFVSVRNIFNGDQYWISSLKNYDRWFEGGLRIKF